MSLTVIGAGFGRSGTIDSGLEMQNLSIRVPGGTGLGEVVQVGLPELFLFGAQAIEVIPGIEAAVMAIVKDDLQRVVADRFDRIDTDIALTGLQHRLRCVVTAHFRRR